MRVALTVARRLVHAAALIAAVIVLNLVLIHLAPGDPALTIAGRMGGATEEILRDIRTAYGLDEPLYRQLLVYASRVVSGDLGYSLYFNAPVTDLILARLGPTILLTGTALLVAATLGSVLGVHAARRPRGPFSSLVTAFSLAGLQFGALLSGAVLVETVFNWPGLGQLAFESILRRDHPTLLGILLFASAMVVIANLLTDLAYRTVDPRIDADASASGGPS